MKLLVVLVLTIIVTVRGKSVILNDDVQKMMAQLKKIDDPIKTDPKKNAETALLFMAGIDADIRLDIIKDTQRTVSVMLDTNKLLQDRYYETAEIAKHTAELWRQAALKKQEEVANDFETTTDMESTIMR